MSYKIDVGNEDLLKLELEMCIDHPFHYVLDILARYTRAINGDHREYSVIPKVNGEAVVGYNDLRTFIMQTRMIGYYYHRLKSVDVNQANKTVTLEV